MNIKNTNLITESLLKRKSVRVFTEQKIDPEIKKMILECSINAPTAGNQVMYTILDITDKDIKDELAILCDNQPFIAKADMVLVYAADFEKWYNMFKLVSDNTRKPGMGDLMLGVSDALIAAQNAVVAAESFGIGSCYIGDIMENGEKIKALLNLKDYHFPIGMLVFGYPSEQQKNRKKPARFDMKYIVHENKYHQLADDELKMMVSEREKANGNVNFEFDAWCRAFYNRKYNSDFTKEMCRSVEMHMSKWDITK